MYAFVDVRDYQKVVVTDSSKGIEVAAKNYLGDKKVINENSLKTNKIVIKDINTDVINGNTYYYDSSYVSDEVVEYWVQGRALIGYIVCSFVVFIVSLVNKLLWKKKYKRLVVALKEAKNVL